MTFVSERVIQQADLSGIENSLSLIHGSLQNVDAGVATVDNRVQVVNDELANLANDLHQFIGYQVGQNNKREAESDLINVKLELEQKFGKYKTVREHAIGILQADDLGIVRKETISTATEELMLATPGYWLAPCLVALSAWINDKPDLAERALKEGIKRNDEKTSLFFALICRRANRKDACLKWTQRYLANQNEENLDRKAIVMLDAYAGGLLGADSDGLIARQMSAWLEHLSEKPGFVEQQRNQWSMAINAKREPVDTSSYTYLRKYSPTWPILEDIMEGANLHGHILSYFNGIFNREATNNSLKEQLDEILSTLVTEFDDEELPLKKREKFDELIIEFDGDKNRAKQHMDMMESSFDTNKDFTQLLTDAAMNPNESHAGISTQKFAIALSRDWITDAYNDIIAQNRMKIPHEIELVLDILKDKTTDGANETELTTNFRQLVNDEKVRVLAQCELTAFEKFCLYGGGAIVAIGVGMLFAGNVFMGLIAIIAGVGAVIHHYSRKKQLEKTRVAIENQCAERLRTGEEIIRAFLAEVVDFRTEFNSRDEESQKVLDFLEQISPEQYVRKLSDSNRKVIV